MSDGSSNEQGPFLGEVRNGIFGMLMALVAEYTAAGYPPQKAVEESCDWLISLAQHVRKASKEIDTKNAEKQNQFFPHVEN